MEDEEIEENVNQNDGDEGVNVRQSEEVKDEEIIEDNNDLVRNCVLFCCSKLEKVVYSRFSLT